MTPFSPPALLATPATPQCEGISPFAVGNPQSEFATGRPRTLTNTKRSEFCTLIADGLGLKYAAKHVGCSIRTIRREMKRDPSFAIEVRECEKIALQHPLRAIKYAAEENWRAGVWLLEHLLPGRFGRQKTPSGIGKRQARQLLKEILQIVDAEIFDVAQRHRIDARIRAAFEYRIHVYCYRKRSAAGLKKAMEWFEQKDEMHDALANLGLFKSNLNAIHDSSSTPSDATGPRKPKARLSTRRAPQAALPLAEVFQDHIDQLKFDLRNRPSPMTKPFAEPQKEMPPVVSSGASPLDKTTAHVDAALGNTP